MIVRGFSPYVFNGEVGNFVSPPTDMVSKTEVTALSSRGDNVADITFGDDPFGKLNALVQSKSIIGLGSDIMLLLKQDFLRNGKNSTRIGLICTVDLEGKESSLIPHESTIREFVDQRKNFLRMTGAQVEPVFLTVSGTTIESYLLSLLPGREKLFSFDDSAGVKNSVYILDDGTRIREISKLLIKAKGIIADGHHRVKALTEINNERKMLGLKPIPLLSYITSLDSNSIEITGIHKLIRKENKDIMKRIKSGFRMRERPSYSSKGNVVFYDGTFREIRPTQLTVRILRSIGIYPETPADYFQFALMGVQTKDSVTQHQEKMIAYTPYEDRAMLEVDRGSAKAAVLMPSWEKEMFRKVVSSGRVLPPKSTFFYPKIFAGIVMSINRD